LTFLICSSDAAVDEQIDSNSFGLFIADVSFSRQGSNAVGIVGIDVPSKIESGMPVVFKVKTRLRVVFS
jgi:hypothetical protein